MTIDHCIGTILYMFAIEPQIYINKDVELRIFNFDNGKKFWIKGGVGFIEFGEEQFDALLELLSEYVKEVYQDG